MLILANVSGALIAQWVFNGLLALFVAWLGMKERERVRKEDERGRAMASLETKLGTAASEGKQLATQLVEERLRAASHEVNNHVHGFVVGLEMLKKDAADRAAEFKELAKQDHENELSVATQISNLKDWMRETFADREDLKSIDAHVRSLERQVAVLSAGRGQ
ncbi:MAG: hypothetical protein WBD40_01400 [Tepidisphaeraceae bacterium]